MLIALRAYAPHEAKAHSAQQVREQRLIDRSIPLFQIVAPTVERQALTIEYSTPIFLSISSRDAAGNEIASVTWDVSRNAVCEVSGSSQMRGISNQMPLFGRGLIGKTRSWLRALGLVPNIDHWRPTGSPIRMNQHRWTVRWRGEGQRAIVQIDDRSGALYLADVRGSSCS
jgi:hypothetical protein